MKTIKTILYISLLSLLFIAGSPAVEKIRAQVRTFTSEQVGTSPQAGKFLQTNGSVSTWAFPSLGSATSTEPLMASWFVATSTTATSTFAGNVQVDNNLGVSGRGIFTGHLNVGAVTRFATIANLPFEVSDSINSYFGMVIGNGSSGTSASADLLFNNNGTPADGTSNYADCGLNSTTYTLSTYTGFNRPRNFYCYNDGPVSIFSVPVAATESYISFGTGGGAAANEAMRITSTGQIAIGTTSPNTLEKISLISQANGYAMVWSDTATNNNDKDAYLGNRLYDNSVPPLRLIGSRNTITENRVYIGGSGTLTSQGTAATSIEFYTGSTNAITNGGTQRMVINSSGNVGIASSTPGAMLGVTHGGLGLSFLVEDTTSPDSSPFLIDANGNVGVGMLAPPAKFSVSSGSSGVNPPLTSGILIEDDNDTNLSILTPDTFQSYITFGNASDSNASQMEWDPVTDIFSLGTANSGADFRFMAGDNSEKMRILDTGEVGIGTTTPFSKFHVTSGASATTTATIGSIGLTTSKSCVNMNRSDGGASSFFINAAGVMIVETNYCR
jgi:hypothetical protein